MQYQEDSDLPLCATWGQLVFDPHRQSESGSGDLDPQSPSPLYPAHPTSTVNEPDEFVQNPLSYVPAEPVPTPDYAPGAEGVYYHDGRWCCLALDCSKKPNGWEAEKNAIHHVQMYHLGKERLQCPWPGWYVCVSPVTRSRTNYMQ